LKIVLDESVPHDLAKALRAVGCDIAAFPNAWKGTKNGQLLARVREAGHQVLLTCDKNMSYQQNISQLKILVAVLPTQRLGLLLRHVDDIARFLAAANPSTGVLVIPLEQHRTGR
jgi:hypothetical protein